MPRLGHTAILYNSFTCISIEIALLFPPNTDFPTIRKRKTGFLTRLLNETGIGLHEYIVFIRLHRAALELVATEDSVTTVAFRCGFSDSNYFKDAFKKKYGVTPRAYRKRA